MAKVLGRDYSTGTLGDNAAWSDAAGRSTVGTLKDWEGRIVTALIGEARFENARRVENLLQDTENLDPATSAWSTFNSVTVTGGQTDPDGGNNAFRITADSAAAYFRQLDVMVGNDVDKCHLHCYVKRVTGSGTVSAYKGDGPLTTDITSIITSSWQRVSFGISDTRFTSGSNPIFGFIISVSGDEIDVYHPQFELVTGQTNQNPSEYVSIGVYRKNHFKHGTYIGDNWLATLNTTLNGGEANGPNNLASSKCTISSAGGTGYAYIESNGEALVVNTRFTYSIYLKYGGGPGWVYLATTGFNENASGYFDIQNGTKGDIGPNTDSSDIESIGDGWYRCSVTWDITNDTGGTCRVYFATANGSLSNNSLDGTSYFYCVDAQVEPSDSATSYIYAESGLAAGTLTYDHGQGLDGPDGVQYFATTNPNTVTSNVVDPEGAPATPITGGYLLLEPAATNYFLNSDAPVTQTVTLVASNEYTFSIVGTGSMTLSGGATGTVTDGNPVTATVSGDVTCTIGGSVDYAQVENGSNATSIIITAGTSVTRTTDLAVVYPLATPQAEGSVEVGLDTYDIASSGAQLIAGFGQSTSEGPILRDASSNAQINDGVNTGTVALATLEALSAKWSGASMEVGYRTAPDTRTFGTPATYDGGFLSDANVYLLDSIKDVTRIVSLDAYNDSNFGGGGAPVFDETGLVNIATLITANEQYTGVIYAETAQVLAAMTVDAVETFDQGSVNENALISSAMTITAVETSSIPIYDETAAVGYTLTVNGTDVYSDPVHDETGRVNIKTSIIGHDVYTGPSPEYIETGVINSRTRINAVPTYTGPSFAEFAQVGYQQVIITDDSYLGPGNNESTIITTHMVLTAFGTWTPPVYNNVAHVGINTRINADDTFTTPSMLPEGIQQLTAQSLGGFTARII